MLILGAVVSITIALFAPNEFAAPGLASVRVASFPAASLIVPLFSASDVVGAAAAAEDPLPAIQSRWAGIRYQLPEGERVKAFDALVNEIGRAQLRAPDELRLQVWKGIVLASEAGARPTSPAAWRSSWLSSR